MRKMVLFVECGVGTKSATAYLVPESITQEQLDDYSWEAACQHGETYGYYPESARPDDEDEDSEDSGDTYVDYIEGWWEEYDAKEHDGELIFGNNRDFNWEEL